MGRRSGREERQRQVATMASCGARKRCVRAALHGTTLACGDCPCAYMTDANKGTTYRICSRHPIVLFLATAVQKRHGSNFGADELVRKRGCRRRRYSGVQATLMPRARVSGVISSFGSMIFRDVQVPWYPLSQVYVAYIVYLYTCVLHVQKQYVLCVHH